MAAEARPAPLFQVRAPVAGRLDKWFCAPGDAVTEEQVATALRLGSFERRAPITER
jgi:biotin carboxyl carrier protein